MKDIIIVCAGSLGKEIYTIINAINRQCEKQGKLVPYKILGFIDDNPYALEKSNMNASVSGSISDWKPIGNEVYAIGASGKIKYEIAKKLKIKGCRFETLIAPWSLVSSDCTMGEGCFITAYSISAGVKLGDFVNVLGSMLCPGTQIGDYSTTTGFTVVDNATNGKNVFVGSHAVVSNGVCIGDNAKISAGSIVYENIKAGATVFGVPAVEIA